MKKVTAKNMKTSTTKRKLWWWIICAFIFGGVVGYASHYVIVNWNGFFATCPNGARPDKNGCCAGEIYTDAGDGWMVCCPEGAENCFPPVK